MYGVFFNMLRLKAVRKIGPRAVRKTKNQSILIKNYFSANVTVRFVVVVVVVVFFFTFWATTNLRNL